MARKIRDAEDARACLSAAAVSGEPRASWARRHGVDARSLNAWRVNLARGAEVAPGVLRLVELVPAEPDRSRVWRVRCGRFEVEVDAVFDEEELVRLLSAVARC